MSTHEAHECGRCGVQGREADVKLTLAAVAREALMDRRPYDGPMFALEYRCRPCREAVRPPRDQR